CDPDWRELPSSRQLRQPGLRIWNGDGAVVQWRRRHVYADGGEHLRLLAVPNPGCLSARFSHYSGANRRFRWDSDCGDRNCNRRSRLVSSKKVEKDADLIRVSLPLYGEKCTKEEVARPFQ